MAKCWAIMKTMAENGDKRRALILSVVFGLLIVERVLRTYMLYNMGWEVPSIVYDIVRSVASLAILGFLIVRAKQGKRWAIVGLTILLLLNVAYGVAWLGGGAAEKDRPLFWLAVFVSSIASVLTLVALAAHDKRTSEGEVPED